MADTLTPSTPASNAPAPWEAVVLVPGDDGTGLLADLRTGNAPIVVLRGFFDDATVAAASVAIDAAAYTEHAYTNATLRTVGPYLMRYLDRPDEYAAEAGTAEAVLAAGGAPGIGAGVRETFCTVFGLDAVEVPTDSKGRPYAEKVIRLHLPGSDNPLHNDKVARDTADRDTVLNRTAVQYSAVLAIQECNGGVLRIFDKVWEPQDEVFKIKGLGYADGVVAGARWVDYKPQRGDLYVFHPEHYHLITLVESGPVRKTIGTFLGLEDDDARRAWAWA